MKIAEAKIDVIEFDVPRISVNDARGGMGGKLTAGVLRLITESGIEGNAHIGDRGGGGASTIRSFQSAFEGRLVGMNLADRELLWHQLPRIVGTWRICSRTLVARRCCIVGRRREGRRDAST